MARLAAFIVLLIPGLCAAGGLNLCGIRYSVYYLIRFHSSGSNFLLDSYYSPQVCGFSPVFFYAETAKMDAYKDDLSKKLRREIV